MKSNQVQLSYRLCFDSPFHFGTGLRSGLIHRAIARDIDGYLYVPGSTLKGVLRDLVGRFAQLFDISVLEPHNVTKSINEFGTQADITASIFGSRLRPSTLYFDDAVMVEEDRDLYDSAQMDKKYIHKQVETRTQVSLSRGLHGQPDPGMLFSSEYGQRELHFQGQIYGLLVGIPLIDQPDSTYSLLLLVAALMSLAHLGGGKSAGQGRVDCTITELKVDGVSIDPSACVQGLSGMEYFELAQGEA